MSENRNERGRFVERVSPDSVFELLLHADEPLTASEIGEELELTNRSALNKLDELHDQEKIQRKEVGASAIVWWCEAEVEALSAAGSPSIGDLADIHQNEGRHDPEGPFFSSPPLDAEGGEPIEVEDTDEILGDALADEWANE